MTQPSQEVQLTPQQKRRFALLAGLLILAVTLLLGEVAVRVLLRYNTPDTIRQNSLQYRPSTFTRHFLAPHQSIDRAKAWGDAAPSSDDSGVSPSHTYSINRHGYRGGDMAIAKPAGTCRIAIVGGSAVFDLGAGEGEDWPHQVERLLQEGISASGLLDGLGELPSEQPPSGELPSGELLSGELLSGELLSGELLLIDTVQVINAGVPGHSSSDAVGKLYADLWRFEPDIVLLYNAWNDVKTFTALSPERRIADLLKPHNPTADPFQHYRGPVDRLLGHSQLYIKLRNRYLLWRYPLGLEGQVADGELGSTFDRAALRQYRLNVEMVVDASRNFGAVPVLLTQASLVTADASEADRRRIAYGFVGLDHAGLVDAMGQSNATMHDVAEAKGVDLVDLDARFSGRSELFDDHVHTSRQGSEEIAAALAAELMPKLAEFCRD